MFLTEIVCQRGATLYNILMSPFFHLPPHELKTLYVQGNVRYVTDTVYH